MPDKYLKISSGDSKNRKRFVFEIITVKVTLINWFTEEDWGGYLFIDNSKKEKIEGKKRQYWNSRTDKSVASSQKNYSRNQKVIFYPKSKMSKTGKSSDEFGF